MKATLIESTNKMLSTGFSGREGELTIDGNANWIRTISDQFHTSAIVSYKLLNKNTVVLHTLNSEYIFELKDCKFDPSGIVHIDKERVERHDKLKEVKSKVWSCQIAGSGYLDGLISVVTLPKPMNKSMAEEYILNNGILDDHEGSLIMSLQSPLDKGPSCD